MQTDVMRWGKDEDDQLQKHEAIIEKGVQSSFASLVAIRDQALYRKTHPTFAAYCRDRWGIGRSQAYRLIDAAAVVQNLSPIGDTLPTTESQARPLAHLQPEQQREAWTEAVETAPNGKPTASHVAAVVEDLFPRRDPLPGQASLFNRDPEAGTRLQLPASDILVTPEFDVETESLQPDVSSPEPPVIPTRESRTAPGVATAMPSRREELKELRINADGWNSNILKLVGFVDSINNIGKIDVLFACFTRDQKEKVAYSLGRVHETLGKWIEFLKGGKR